MLFTSSRPALRAARDRRPTPPGTWGLLLSAAFVLALLALSGGALSGCRWQAQSGGPPELEPEPPAGDDTTEAPGGAAPATPVTLPVEVIGPPDGTVETRTVQLDDTSGVTHLYLRVHRPAYRDQKVNANRRAKASVRVGEGPWTDLTNRAVTVAPREASNGGIGGGPHTIRMAVAIDSVRKGANTIAFRFNGTDGITSGYRVVELNLLRGGLGGTRVFPPARFEEAGPSHWSAPEGYGSPDSIASGRRLWREAELVESLDLGYEQEPIRATCSACHTDDGRDLKYFGYSNKSIKWRARFHGLSESEGLKIAAYIRELDSVRTPPNGRPWNPPYQPGPGLDAAPSTSWSAGAGIDAILDRDESMQGALFAEETFPEGPEAGRVPGSELDYDEELNVREIPVAFELPDWNSWLPNTHPIDIWGQTFLESAPLQSRDADGWRPDVLGLYQRLAGALEERGPEALIERGEMLRFMAQFGGSARVSFLHDGPGMAERPEGVSGGEAKRAIRAWGATKLWGLHQEHGLHPLARDVFGEEAEARSWLTDRSRSLFDLAPHLSADNDTNFPWQDVQVGKYRSSSWYQLQMTVNPGNNHGTNTRPVDWNYQPIHIKDMQLYGGAGHPMRLTQTFTKMLQQYSTADGLEDFYVRQIHPGMYAPRGKMSTPFDRMEDTELRARLYEVLLTALMRKIESHTRQEWIWMQYEGEFRNRLRDSTYTPKPLGDVPLARALQSHRWVDGWREVIPRFRSAGVSEDILERMIAWAEQMWPTGDWHELRAQ